VKALLSVVDPPGFEATIGELPVEPLGVIKVTCVSDTTLTLAAAEPPTVTPVIPVKLLPVSVSVVPPVEAPLTGETELIIGAVEKDRAYNNLLGEPEPGLPTTFGVAAEVKAIATCVGVAVRFNPKYTAAAPAT